MSGSIAAELMSLINAMSFIQIVPPLMSGSGLSEVVFPRTTLAQKFSLEMKRWLDGSYMNPSALFELFGEYSNDTALKVSWYHQKMRS